jgi:hypothetical protein
MMPSSSTYAMELEEKVALGRGNMGILVLERMVASSSLRAGGGDPEVEPRLAILRISGGLGDISGPPNGASPRQFRSPRPTKQGWRRMEAVAARFQWTGRREGFSGRGGGGDRIVEKNDD